MTTSRRVTINDDLIRQYSRRGNFHSEASEAASLGLPGLVAQGTQVCGPAYGMLLDAWGEEFVAHGRVDVRFVGMVVGGETIEASIEISENGTATVAIENVDRGRTAVVGTAARRA